MENKILKQTRFIRVATRRTNLILNSIDKLEKCANTNNYDYTTQQVDLMFNAITEKLVTAKKSFINNQINKKIFKF